MHRERVAPNPWSIVLDEKLLVSQLAKKKKIPAFYGTIKFSSIPIKPRHCSQF
jgi:hypothetical protein